MLFDHFPNDENMALRSLDDFIFEIDQLPVSPVLGSIQRALYFRDVAQVPSHGYPRGIPYIADYTLRFRLEKIFEGLAALVPDLPAPYFAYLHLFPPHSPYKPTGEYFNTFNDGWSPVEKPVHRLSDKSSISKMNNARRIYDEYIASVD